MMASRSGLSADEADEAVAYGVAGGVEGGVQVGEEVAFASPKEALADDLLHGGRGFVAQVFEVVPLFFQFRHLLLKGEQALGKVDDGRGGVVVALVHGLGAFIADALLFLFEGLGQQTQRGGDVNTTSRPEAELLQGFQPCCPAGKGKVDINRMRLA